MLNLSEDQLKTLRSKLPKGYVRVLSDTTNLSERTIRAVLYGERNNADVINTAQLLAEQYEKKKREKIMDAIS